jgi:hypothetical protein
MSTSPILPLGTPYRTPLASEGPKLQAVEEQGRPVRAYRQSIQTPEIERLRKVFKSDASFLVQISAFKNFAKSLEEDSPVIDAVLLRKAEELNIKAFQGRQRKAWTEMGEGQGEACDVPCILLGPSGMLLSSEEDPIEATLPTEIVERARLKRGRGIKPADLSELVRKIEKIEQIPASSPQNQADKSKLIHEKRLEIKEKEKTIALKNERSSTRWEWPGADMAWEVAGLKEELRDLASIS